METENLPEIGRDMVAFASSKAPFTAARLGVIEQLFPYVWLAAKRMSLRAISNWLETERGVALSASTLSRAMRNKDKYWQVLLDFVDADADEFGDFKNLKATDVLELSDEEFSCLLDEGFTTQVADADGYISKEKTQDFHAAGHRLSKNWFSVPAEARAECLQRMRALRVADEASFDAEETANTDEEAGEDGLNNE